MPNYLPLLLLGGGAAYILTQDKKKEGYKFKHLEIGPGCKTVHLGGRSFIDEMMKLQGGDESDREQMMENLKLFWSEDVPALIEKANLDEKFSEDPATFESEVRKNLDRLVKVGAPSCYVSDEVLRKAMMDALKGSKSPADIQKKVRPYMGKLAVKFLIGSGYYLYLFQSGVLEELPNFEEELFDMVPGMQTTGGEEPPIDPNQMAMMRPGVFTEAATDLVG